jgi:hypothetical protein
LIDDISYLASVSDFIRLLKEAETLFEFGFYTGCIALTGISAEDFTKFLSSNLGREDLVDESQYRRINTLKSETLITESIHSSLDVIRNIRNDCLHYNQGFKQKGSGELKTDAIQVLNEFKKILRDLIGEPRLSPEKAFNNFLKVMGEVTKQSVSENYESVKSPEDMNLKLRNASSILLGMPTAFHPNTEIVVFSGIYTVAEVDLDNEPPEITLEDASNGLPVIVDLEEDDKHLLKKEGIKEGDIVQARIRSEVSKIGQTAAWKFLNLRKM